MQKCEAIGCFAFVEGLTGCERTICDAHIDDVHPEHYDTCEAEFCNGTPTDLIVEMARAQKAIKQ